MDFSFLTQPVFWGLFFSICILAVSFAVMKDFRVALALSFPFLVMFSVRGILNRHYARASFIIVSLAMVFALVRRMLASNTGNDSAGGGL